jgi:hypothetical protein
MRRSSRFRASTLLLAVVLSAAPAFARGPQPVPTVEVHGFLGSLWNALSGLLPMLTKGRDTIDPNGVPADGRGTIDPNGLTDGRGTIDPDGAATVPVTTDGRSTIDPNG